MHMYNSLTLTFQSIAALAAAQSPSDMLRSHRYLQHLEHPEEFVRKHLTVPKDSLCAEGFRDVCGDVRSPEVWSVRSLNAIARSWALVASS
jgi:hypothetical protein